MADVRITETSEDRLTETGETRVVDASVHLGALLLTSSAEVVPLLQGGATVLFGDLVLNGSLNVSMTMAVKPSPINRPIPERHYIWVYNLAGERVDVIA